MSQGGGWLARARRIVDEHQLDTVERGYLLVPEGLMAIGAGEPGSALERFAVAAADLDDEARAALEDEVVARCAPFVEGDNTVLEPNLLIVSGHRGHEAGSVGD